MTFYVYSGPFVSCPKTNKLMEAGDKINDVLAFIDIEGGNSYQNYIFVPNKVPKDAPRSFASFSYYDVPGDMPLTVDSELELEWFERTYKEEIKILTEHFGAAVVEWGVVPHFG